MIPSIGARKTGRPIFANDDMINFDESSNSLRGIPLCYLGHARVHPYLVDSPTGFDNRAVRCLNIDFETGQYAARQAVMPFQDYLFMMLIPTGSLSDYTRPPSLRSIWGAI